MTQDLSDYEAGARFAGDYDEALRAVQDRLARIQVAHVVHGRRSIVVIEGWDGAGKGGIIQRLTAKLDPRHVRVWPIGARSADEKARHFLWRFWARLPGRGEIAVFERSWYGRVLAERVERQATEAQCRRAYDEINEFEAQQKDDGTAIVKLFVHVTREVQDARLRERLSHPWKRWKIGEEAFRNRPLRGDHVEAIAAMLAHTDTRWSPWRLIDGNDKKAARIAALTYIADRLEKSVPMTPPVPDPDLVRLARTELDLDI